MLIVSFPADSSLTAPVMYGVAWGLPRPLLQGPGKAGRKTAMEILMRVSFHQILQVFSSSSSSSMCRILLLVIWCVYLLSAEYTFMGSLIIREVVKDLIPKGIKQAKVVMLSGTRWVCFIALQPTTFGHKPASSGPSGPSSCPTSNQRRSIVGASSCQQ